jgi:hypothetical protein
MRTKVGLSVRLIRGNQVLHRISPAPLCCPGFQRGEGMGKNKGAPTIPAIPVSLP